MNKDVDKHHVRTRCEIDPRRIHAPAVNKMKVLCKCRVMKTRSTASLKCLDTSRHVVHINVGSFSLTPMYIRMLVKISVEKP